MDKGTAEIISDRRETEPVTFAGSGDSAPKSGNESGSPAVPPGNEPGSAGSNTSRDHTDDKSGSNSSGAAEPGAPAAIGAGGMPAAAKISKWWYMGHILFWFITGFACYFVHRDDNPAGAKQHLVRSIWFPIVFWAPIYAIFLIVFPETGGMYLEP